VYQPRSTLLNANNTSLDEFKHVARTAEANINESCDQGIYVQLGLYFFKI
jgi:hypothetical protein